MICRWTRRFCRTSSSEALRPARQREPFELGIAIGAERFARTPVRDHTVKIMVADPWVMPQYLSDLGGNDLEPHENTIAGIFRIVRGFLQRDPVTGAVLPGAQHLTNSYSAFRARLPDIAAGIGHEDHEVTGFAHYTIFLTCVHEYLAAAHLQA